MTSVNVSTKQYKLLLSARLLCEIFRLVYKVMRRPKERGYLCISSDQ